MFSVTLRFWQFFFELNPFREHFCPSKNFHVFFFPKENLIKYSFSVSSLAMCFALLLSMSLARVENTPSLATLKSPPRSACPGLAGRLVLGEPRFPGSLPLSLVHSCQHSQWPLCSYLPIPTVLSLLSTQPPLLRSKPGAELSAGGF